MTRFERCALGVLGVAVAGAAVAGFLTPVGQKTAIPKAALEREPAQPAVEWVIQVAMESDPRSRGPEVVASADHLSRTFARLGYDLESVFRKDQPVPRVFLASLPRDMKEIREIKTRKALFFKSILPLVLQANEEILKDRKRLWQLRTAMRMGRQVSAVDRLWLSVIREKYRVKSRDIDELLLRVDVIPPSMALAQAAEESGWGTSRFVREGNAIFGQWTFSKSDAGIAPLKRDPGKNHRIKAFDSLQDSVRAYALNLNTNQAYAGLRALRADMRRAGSPIDGSALARTLSKYSERGMAYVNSIRSIISVNRLRQLDDARLAGEPDEVPLQMAGDV